jgi:hypothetical protein
MLCAEGGNDHSRGDCTTAFKFCRPLDPLRLRDSARAALREAASRIFMFVYAIERTYEVAQMPCTSK